MARTPPHIPACKNHIKSETTTFQGEKLYHATPGQRSAFKNENAIERSIKIGVWESLVGTQF